MVRYRKSSQRGLALLSVLLMLTLGLLLAMALSERLQLQMRSSAGLQNQEQAWLYAMSAEQLAKKGLQQDFKDDSEVTHLSQYWATAQTSLPVGDGSVSGGIKDMQGCFNLNALSHPDKSDADQNRQTHRNISVLVALLENIDVDRYQAEQIAQATRDWVYPKTEPESPRGADDNDYLSLPVSYLAGNTDMRDESEWRAVWNVNVSMAQRMMPFLCAIPEHELRININTIADTQPELLAAVLENQISVDQARDILEQRPREGWQEVSTFLAEPQLAGIDSSRLAESLTVKSFYFELDARVDMPPVSTRLRSLMVRSKDDELIVIRRRTGET